MTRELCKELQPILNAFAEGKIIEVKTKDPNDNLWIETHIIGENPNLMYRIKPEAEYRPFEDFNELMSITGTKLIWVVDKCCFNEFLITGTQKHAVFIFDRWYSMKELFELYTFSDGSTCGIKE